MPIYEKPIKQFYAGTSSVVNDNNVPNVPLPFQTQTYYPPQGSVISDPNLATPPMAQDMTQYPMQQESIPAGVKGNGLRGLVESGQSDTVEQMGYNPATAQMKNNAAYKKSCGMKKYGARQDDKNIFDKAGDALIKTGSPIGVAHGIGLKVHPANLVYKAASAAKSYLFGDEEMAKSSAKDYAKNKANELSGN